MSRPVLVLRPPPGDTATAALVEAAGLRAIRLPLFAASPVDWTRPPGDFDALLLTSANAVRLAGAAFASVRDLPVVAVGAATASAARQAGLIVAATGGSDAEAALAEADVLGLRRLLWLAGRERTPLAGVTDVIVYAADPFPLDRGALRVARGTVALLHSPRAARRFAQLVDCDAVARQEVRIAALSAAVAKAAGAGWAACLAADHPRDTALVKLAERLAIDR